MNPQLGANNSVSTPLPKAQQAFFENLRPPQEETELPAFGHGWSTPAGEPLSHLTYVDFTGLQWSDDLEELHEESSRDHFMDVLTRTSLIDAIQASVTADGVVADLGCSTGYLLEDLEVRFPAAQLVGVDVVAAGLRKAHLAVPDAALLLADVCDLPVGDATVQAVVSANMLEHVADDKQALREIKRILVPGGFAALVVPFGQSLFDYYDRFLGHERRYGRGELRRKAQDAGLEVVASRHLGQYLYPPFFAVKKKNRLMRDSLRGGALETQVEKDIASTTNSKIGSAACQLEHNLGRRNINLPFGIRELIVVTKSFDDR